MHCKLFLYFKNNLLPLHHKNVGISYEGAEILDEDGRNCSHLLGMGIPIQSYIDTVIFHIKPQFY